MWGIELGPGARTIITVYAPGFRPAATSPVTFVYPQVAIHRYDPIRPAGLPRARLAVFSCFVSTDPAICQPGLLSSVASRRDV